MNHNMIMIILNIEDDDDDDDYNVNSYDEDPSTCCGQCVRDKNSPVKLWNSYQNLELWNSYQNLKLWNSYQNLELSLSMFECFNLDKSRL